MRHHVPLQRYVSRVADEQSSWLQHLKQTAKGQAESLGAQSIVNCNRVPVQMYMYLVFDGFDDIQATRAPVAKAMARTAAMALEARQCRYRPGYHQRTADPE